MKETKFLAPILLESPLMFEILEKIREKYSIDKLDPNKDPYKQRVRQDMEQDPPIDWQAVRQDLEAEIRAIPDLLPPEFAAVQRLLEAKKTLPAEPTFTEPITDKLRADVTAFYHLFAQLFTLFTDTLAAPWQTAIESCYAALVDMAWEYLYSETIRDIPQDWISAIQTVPLFGDDVVMAIVGPMADPDEFTEQLRQRLKETFPPHRPKLTKKNLPFAKYSAMRLRRVPIKDIADEYIQDHRRQFPSDPESIEYRRAKRKLEENLKKITKRQLLTFDAMLGDKNS